MRSALRRRLPILLVLVGLAGIAVGSGVLRGPARIDIDPVASQGPSKPAAAPDVKDGIAALDEIGRAAAAGKPVGIDPHRLRIPAIGVDAPVIDLGYESQDAIEVPDTAGETGWFTPSRLPGEIGPAIIAGHVDLNKGPAVFFRLRDLRPGDEVVVEDESGGARTFVVDRLGQYPKQGLPDDVFGFAGSEPELRLITCGGVFNRSTGHYEDNIVVYARAA